MLARADDGSMGMAEVDPIREFETWKASRPWGASVLAVLKRGALEPDDVYVASLAIPVHLRGNGYAREIMSKLAEVADAAGVPVTLEVSMESESSGWLEGWYERLGYEAHPDGYGEYGPFMVRPAPVPSPSP